MNDKQREKLARHVADLGYPDGIVTQRDRITANEIGRQPQAHIDALVAAGVLTHCYRVNGRALYGVAPPTKPKITYEASINDDACRWCWRCSCDQWAFVAGFTSPEVAKSSSEAHARSYHEHDDVTFGPLPKPHHHHFTWQWHDGQGWRPYCPCGTWLDQWVAGSPYSGPIPAHLQASPEELDTSQRAQRVKEGL